MDLSFPHGKSVKDGLDADMASLSYIKVEVATRAAQMGRESLLAEFDIEEAYRIVPVHPDNKHLLGIVWNNQLYIDAALPFGLRSAPLIFTALADALQWAIQQRGVPYIAHSLEDYYCRTTQFRPVCPIPTNHNGNM